MADLRTWLNPLLEAGAVLSVDDLVDPVAYECAAILKQLDVLGTRAPVLFTAPRTLSGRHDPYRLLFNLYADPRCIAASLGRRGLAWPELLEAFLQRLDQDIPVQRSAATPVQSIIERACDLRDLPFVRHVEMEGGPYFTPIVVSRGPTGRYNLSWNRCMYLDPQHLAIHMSPRHLWSYARGMETQGQPLPIALTLGHHPLFQQAASGLVRTDRDEYEAAGGMMGEAVNVAASVTFGEDLLVPSDAEVIIEGEILPGKRTLEGPFGEYMRYLGPEKVSHVVRVRALTRREDPYIAEIFAAHADHLNATIGLEANLLHAARAAVPSVVGTSWFHGGGPTTLVISLQKIADGLPMRAALAAMAVSNYVKQVILVDDDIDPQDPHDVLWAISTRTNAESDITILKGLQGSVLDPSLGSSLSTSGFVIDATKPLDRPYPARAKVPVYALSQYPLERYAAQQVLAEIESRLAAFNDTTHDRS